MKRLFFSRTIPSKLKIPPSWTACRRSKASLLYANGAVSISVPSVHASQPAIRCFSSLSDTDSNSGDPFTHSDNGGRKPQRVRLYLNLISCPLVFVLVRRRKARTSGHFAPVMQTKTGGSRSRRREVGLSLYLFPLVDLRRLYECPIERETERPVTRTRWHPYSPRDK